MAVERRLPIGYYADNFRIVLGTAAERYGDLLTEAESAFYDGFTELSTPAQRLYVRLVSRKGPRFRRDRLDYPEIPDLDRALGELRDAGFADDAPDDEVDLLLSLLLRPELADLVRELTGLSPGAAPRGGLEQSLIREVETAVLRRAVRERVEVIRPLHADHVETFRLLFFGNLHQDWTEFVLRDLGVVRFESYELRHDLRRFASRGALEDSLLLYGLRDAFHRLLAADREREAMRTAELVLDRAEAFHPSTHRLRDHVLEQAGRHLERQGRLDDALRFYRAAKRPPARERRARVLARLGKVEEALALCHRIEEGHRDETEARFAPRFAHQLRRRMGEKLPPRRRRHRPAATLAVERRDGAAVEQLALEALEAGGRRGFFSENWLWQGLFGLAFWDVVFAPVEGAFQHPFQYGPLDLHSPDFRAARAAAVERRLDELRSDPAPGPRLMAVYDAKRDVANRLVAWHQELRPLFELALSRLHGRHLAIVCDRLSRDLRRYRRGFPDLFVLDDEIEAGFRLYEVKGPGDQLRPEQKTWLDYFNDQGIRASILRVRWKGAV
jgi:hypothetical protein